MGKFETSHLLYSFESTFRLRRSSVSSATLGGVVTFSEFVHLQRENVAVMGSRKDRSIFVIRAWCSGVPMDTFFIRAWCSGVPPSPNTILVPSFEHRVGVLSRIGQIVRPAHIHASSWGYEERS